MGFSFLLTETLLLVGIVMLIGPGNVDDRKSTFGGCFFLGNNLISKFSKKHNCVSMSTSEAEYIEA